MVRLSKEAEALDDRKKPLAARDRILRAAEKVFGESGFAGARTRDIAAEAKTNISQIHYYFRSKDDLYGAVLRRYIEEVGAALEQVLVEPASAAERVAKVIEAHFSVLASHADFPRIMMDAVLRMPAAAKEIAATGMRPLFERLVPGLLEAGASGDVRDLDFRHAVLSAIGMNVIYFVARPLVEQVFGPYAYAPAGLEARKDAVTDLFLRGVLRRGGEGAERNCDGGPAWDLGGGNRGKEVRS